MTATQNKTKYDVKFRFHTEMTIAQTIAGIMTVDQPKLVDHSTLEIKNVYATLHSISFVTRPTGYTASHLRQMIRQVVNSYLEGGVEVAAVVQEDSCPIDGPEFPPEPEDTLLEETEETPVKEGRTIALTEKCMLDALLMIFPEATIGEDNDGQLVVYTAMRFETVIVPFELK